jgi:hypothetical protein
MQRMFRSHPILFAAAAVIVVAAAISVVEVVINSFLLPLTG